MSAANAGLIKLKNDSKELKRELKQLGKDNNAGLIDKRFYNGRSEYLFYDTAKVEHRITKFGRDTGDCYKNGNAHIHANFIFFRMQVRGFV